jgi:hypothetical protein
MRRMGLFLGMVIGFALCAVSAAYADSSISPVAIRRVPELDGSTAALAVAFISGSLLVINSRRNRRRDGVDSQKA